MERRVVKILRTRMVSMLHLRGMGLTTLQAASANGPRVAGSGHA
jgi:hypothetical protein